MKEKKSAKKTKPSKIKDVNNAQIEKVSEKKRTKEIIKVLGIDLSIGKVKLCILNLNRKSKEIGGGWSSLPVNFEQISERHYEFTKGLIIAIEAFLNHHSATPSEIESIVFCTGGAFYMFKSFADGMRYVGGILKVIFPRQKIYFTRCDGELVELKEVFELPDNFASAFCCTNFVGTSILATKIMYEGLAIDMGTISTSIIPILQSKIDPIAQNNPYGYTQHRYSTGKHTWYGVMHTPLNFITYQAKTKKAKYNLILRSCSTNTLCSLLDLIDSSIADTHVILPETRISEKELCLLRLAETVGLDINSLSKDELIEIAQNIHEQFIDKIADIIRDILTNMSYITGFESLKVLASGLGQDSFIIPALKKCGFSDEQIITLAEDKISNLWTATSVYGIALLALEKIVGEPINISFESLIDNNPQ